MFKHSPMLKHSPLRQTQISMVQVTAVTHPGKFQHLETLILTKDGVKLELTQLEWEEIQSTLNGKREVLASEELDGYYPRTMFLFNNPKESGAPQV
jgi:hypothetical protein